jgi:hypothetical protein
MRPLLLLLPSLAFAAPRITLPTAGGGGYATIQDETAPLTQRTTINFAGAGVSCADNAGATRTDCTISGGGAGSANVVAVTLDFGANGASDAAVAVTGQAWVTAASVIVCAPTLVASTGRPEGTEDALIEGLTSVVYSRVAGTGFTLRAAPRYGRAYGQFVFHCTGA